MAKGNSGNMGTLVLVGALGVGVVMLMAKKSSAAALPGISIPETPVPPTDNGPSSPESSSTISENGTTSTKSTDPFSTGIVQSTTDNLSDEEKINTLSTAGDAVSAALAFNLPVSDTKSLPEVLTKKEEDDLVDSGEITEELILKHPVVAKKILAKKSTTAGVKISNTLIAVTTGMPILAALSQLTTGVNRKKKATRVVKFAVNKAVLANNVKKAGGTAAVVAAAKTNGKPTAAGQAVKILSAPTKTKTKKPSKKAVKKTVKKVVKKKAVVKKKKAVKKPVTKKKK